MSLQDCKTIKEVNAFLDGHDRGMQYGITLGEADMRCRVALKEIEDLQELFDKDRGERGAD